MKGDSVAPSARASRPKERGILFSAPMVRALLDGRKTVTRRLIKPQPVDGDTICKKGMEPGWIVGQLRDSENAWRKLKCRYGKPGDRLWVRETWANLDGEGVVYRATDEGELSVSPTWKPSLHMPRRASRLTLEITDVRAERLQDITEQEARAEGMTGSPNWMLQGHPTTCLEDFEWLWGNINGKESWDSNPWVWAVSFRRIEEKK